MTGYFSDTHQAAINEGRSRAAARRRAEWAALSDDEQFSDAARAFKERLRPSGEDECWLWDDRGVYGLFVHRGLQDAAHRFSYRVFNGPLAPRAYVRHTCSVKSCVNPRHLTT